MQAAPARYVSVSELYSTDEVELLLDEIRELEPTSCRGEDVQDFEIAGSGCGGGAGGRSPAGTELTERSWDSHAQYLREPPPRPVPLAPLYCHRAYLLSLDGLLTLLVVLCSASACSCVWGAGGVRLGSGARPLALAALSSALLQAVLGLMRLSQLHRLMPLDWPALGVYVCLWSGVSLCGGASVLLYAALAAPQYSRPPLVRDLYLAAVGLAYCGALFAGAAGGVGAWRRWSGSAASRRGSEGARGAYRAVPTASPAPPPPRPPRRGTRPYSGGPPPTSERATRAAGHATEPRPRSRRRELLSPVNILKTLPAVLTTATDAGTAKFPSPPRDFESSECPIWVVFRIVT